MKKLLPVLIVVIIAIGLWFAMSSTMENEGAPPPPMSDKKEAAAPQGGQDAAKPEQDQAPRTGGEQAEEETEGEGGGEETATDDRPATERYKTAEEALTAIKAAAADYDDLVLDQFTEPGANCTWCDSFYGSIKELMLSPDTKPDQRSYYAEVLAISGRVDNVKALVDSIANAKNEEEADAYAEALELTVGKDDVVKYLGEQLSRQNETLREASVAAVTNQGSRLAVETLYNHTVEKGDPDGYYSLGIGLGEVVPDEDAMPYLQELAMKHDQYSHLAVKSLLNAGLDGVKIVTDILSTSKNPEADKEMLKGAKDHVSYDEDVVAHLKQLADSGKDNQAVTFSKEVLADFEQAEKESEAANEGIPAEPPPAAPPMSMLPQGQ